MSGSQGVLTCQASQGLSFKGNQQIDAGTPLTGVRPWCFSSFRGLFALLCHLPLRIV